MSASFFLLSCLLWCFRIEAISVTKIRCEINNDDQNLVLTKNLSSKSTIKETCPKGTTRVSIEGGDIRNISKHFLNGIETLHSFEVENLNLKTIESETFKNLSKIDTLQLTKTNLSVIKSRAFANLSNLYLLDLSDNKLSVFRKGMFENVTTKYLDLTMNQIIEIEEGALSGLSVICFYLRYNKLQKINPAGFNHPELTILNLDNNEISVLRPGDLANLPNLTLLSLLENKIKTIPEGVFNGSSIEYLDLKNNKIETIATRAFDNLHNFERIYLDYNKLKTWNADWFHGSNRIFHLCVSYNFIDNIPDEAFKNLVGCEFLNFDNNQIKTISNNAFKGANLTSLILSNNRLEKLNLKQGIKGIEILDLSGNNISCSEANNIQNTSRIVHLAECY